ncbi:LysR family transcriptional regulator [Allonocardiopsis opalescens]|uniref:DNA-binding transcriptional LysR family regulator n=1 Tax=Allonocardiopsis opalescens TaxID=1144618 RepID=A0A2T0PVZ2_9ACTN|nr:LysR family transcriptional regulator [Allonocardiopsis opalescens]PRX95704.1 DNA-binding transcriptional LysR family regulator [Allonocardiopsis opalescens]
MDELSTADGLDALAPLLRLFASAAAHEHVTRAAAELGLPQPTVSRRLERMQRELGATLLERTGRGVRLTRAGALLLPRVRRALDELELGLAEIAAAGSPEHGRVALAFLPTLGAQVVPALIRGFRADHPRVRFTLMQDPSAVVLSRLREGAVDLALTSPLPSGPGLRSQVLHVQPLVLLVPEDHPLAGRRSVALAEAAGESFVGFKHGIGLRQITDELCRAAGFEPELAFEGEDADTVRGLVAVGLGVAVLPRQRRRRPGTAALAITDPPAARTLGLVWRSSALEPAVVAAFRDFVLAEGARLTAGLT